MTGPTRGKTVILIRAGQDEFGGILSVPVGSRTVPGGVLVVRKRLCGVGTFRDKMVILTRVDWGGLGTVWNDTGRW